MLYDVLIIGAGVTGAFTARVLSRFHLKVCVLEKEDDVAMGTSKANSAIVHAGYDAVPGSLKARFNAAGNARMEQVCRELEVPFRRIGSLTVAFKGEDRTKLQELYERGVQNGIPGLSIIDGEQLRKMEPNLSENAEAALHAPTGGIVCPYELTLGAMENAVGNGVELRLNSEVKNIRYEEGLFAVRVCESGDSYPKEKAEHVGKSGGKGLETNGTGDVLYGRYIVNAAGLYSDSIAAMIGDHSFSIHPRRGEYILLDKSMGGTVHSVIFQLPTDKGKGILVTPTVDGNLLIGPNAEDTGEKEDTATTAAGLAQVIKGARKSVPFLTLREEINAFAGLRAKPSRPDFVIEPSGMNSHFIHAAGIESPGLTAAPAVGEYVAELLENQGLRLEGKQDYTPLRKRIKRFRELPEEELRELIRREPAYGRIICRCETVTEGEVLDSIRRPVGARSVDGVKRRTRSGMGRCQGGFCAPRIVEILARELGIPMEMVTKSGGKSRLLVGKVK